MSGMWDRIVEMHRRGRPSIEIADTLGCSKKYVWNVISAERQRAGRPPRPRHTAAKPRRTEDDAAMVRKLHAAGMSVDEIKREMRMGGLTVRRILRGEWAEASLSERVYWPNQDVTAAPDDDLADLYDDRTYDDDPASVAEATRPVVVRPYLPPPGALGEAMS